MRCRTRFRFGMAGPARLCRGRPIRWSGGRYRVAKKLWRADRGLDWNPGRYEVGEEIVNIEGNVYRCTESSGAGAACRLGPLSAGHGDGIAEDQGNLRYVWRYVGRFGESGETPPFAKKKTVRDNNQDWFLDGLVQWQYLSLICAREGRREFRRLEVQGDGPGRAEGDRARPLRRDRGFRLRPCTPSVRRARMLDFWKRMAASQWANHPQVMFELWNESEDIGAHRGGLGSWADQKPAIQETIDAIRAAGARNIIIVPTPFYSTWAGEATASPLSGPNIAHAVHQYREQWEAYPANREQIMKGLASGQAIVVTEWGDNTGDRSGEDVAKRHDRAAGAASAARAR